LVTRIIDYVFKRTNIWTLKGKRHVGRQARVENIDENECSEAPGHDNKTNGLVNNFQITTCKLVINLVQLINSISKIFLGRFILPMIGDGSINIHSRVAEGH